MKRFLKVFSIVMLFVLSIMTVKADAVKETLKADSYVIGEPIAFPDTAHDGYYSFHVNKDESGKYVFCAYYSKRPPAAGVTFTKGAVVTDNGMNYILNKAYNISSDEEMFKYQTALWVYMVEHNLMGGTHRDIDKFIVVINNATSGLAREIRQLVNEANSASANDTSNPGISVNHDNVHFTLSGNYYVSDKISVSTTTGWYNVDLTSAPEGSTVEKNGNTFVIKVPANKVTKLQTSVSFRVNTAKDVYTSYYYGPSDVAYQEIAVTYKDTKHANATGNLVVEKTVSIPVLKVDASTNKGLSGAKLEVKNSAGKVIDSWTSTTEAHEVKGLTEGTYTLTETKAPTGYKIVDGTITFKVDGNGNVLDAKGNKIEQIIVSNELKTTSILVLKVDADTNKPLKGAKLQIKNSAGKVVDSWTSTNEAHEVKGLVQGTYTLTETEAPKGYKVVDGSITFKVDAEGNITDQKGSKIQKIVISNELKTGGVSISKQDITNKEEVPGATLVVKDANGKEIDSWVSTDQPHIIEGLKPGKYTLTETIAPQGYILSDETIEFTVKDDGSITKVVMYNTPATKEEVPVENTASFKTMTSSIVGMIIIAVGSFIIFKNSKKEEF